MFFASVLAGRVNMPFLLCPCVSSDLSASTLLEGCVIAPVVMKQEMPSV